ncbi:MAG: thiaminase II [Chloroflexi bacterium]|nr:thiaminase II [Chloroflexota bacterium]MDA1226417.1 thiaminase II [Chloroflexota bacterium]
MGFSDELRRAGAEMWDREKQHPFVTGIGDGTLELDKFRYYMRQDYIFLIDFCRAISLAVAKAKEVEDMGWFAQLLHETLNKEMALHISFCKDFGITEAELRSTEPSPTTLAYTRHLLQTGYSADIGAIATSMLPCSWGYSEIGQMLSGRGAPEGQPLYGRWIEMYNAPEFAELADWLRSFIDRTAESCGAAELKRMEQVFIASSQYEYMFWEAAYRMEQWPI